MVFHGDDQHGLCAVAVFPVKVPIVAEVGISYPVGILNVQDLPGRRRVSCHAVRVDGQDELAEGHRMAVTLREPEDKLFAALGILLHQCKVNPRRSR